MNNPDDESIYVSMTAEQVVLASVMTNPGLLPDILDVVNLDDFVNMDHRTMFQVICDLADNHKTIDAITVGERAHAINNRFDLGYIADLYRHEHVSANALAYAAMLRERSKKRAVYWQAGEVVRYLNDHPDISGDAAIEQAQAMLMALGEERKALEAVGINTAMREYVNHLDYLHQQGDVLDGLASGLFDLDQRVNGYKPGNLIILAGRPSMGKTTLALAMAIHFSVDDKHRGLFFSLEMSNNELMQKMLAAVGRIPLHQLDKPAAAGDGMWSKLSAAVATCKDSPLHIVDAAGIHLTQLKTYVRKAHRREPLAYIMVDHMHLLDADGKSPVERLGAITRELKRIAKELGVPVFLLAQLNRGVEQRNNKRPLLSDLRESGKIEEDADIVHLLYRDEYYNEDSPNPGVIEMITAKFRNGSVGTDRFAALLHVSRIEDLAPGTYNAPKPVANVRGLREEL